MPERGVNYSVALEKQVEILRWMEGPEGSAYFEEVKREALIPREFQYRDVFIGILERAEPFYWDGMTCGLLERSAPEMPDYSARVTDVPSRDGFWWFARPLSVRIPNVPENTTSVRGLAISTSLPWSFIGTAEVECPTITIGALMEVDSRPGVFPFTLVNWDEGESISSWESRADGGSFAPFVRLVAAALAFLSQHLLATSAFRPDRAARRRLAAVFPHEKQINVVELRQKDRTGARSEPGDPIDWQYRWFVSGHWRRQACGPGMKDHRTLWVGPYIKGPPERPLKPKPQRLFAVVR